MFQCDKCRRSSAPGQSPFMTVTSTRLAEYPYKDAEDTFKIAVGREIVKMQKWCADCAGHPIVPEGDGGYDVNMRGAKAAHTHSRRCNKKIEDCKVCQQIQAFFSLLPPHHAADALSEPSAPPATFSFGTLILDSTFVRGCDRGYRAMCDKAAGMHLLKQYESDGGKIGATSH